jgi:hypothetical protein
MTHNEIMNEWARRLNYVAQLFREGEIDLAEFDERNAAVEGWFETEYAKVVG